VSDRAIPTNCDVITHRAAYTLELGLWHATCRICDWRVVDPDRRRAAAQFRQHIRAASESQRDVEGGISRSVYLDVTQSPSM
jgi:hypothetical protein